MTETALEMRLAPDNITDVMVEDKKKLNKLHSITVKIMRAEEIKKKLRQARQRDVEAATNIQDGE